MNTKDSRLLGVLSLPLDSPEFVAALGVLSSFYTTNTPEARRNLRGHLEQRCLDVNTKFLAAFQNVQKQLALVQSDIEAMGSSCEAMRTDLKEARLKTSKFLSESDALMRERDKLKDCSSVVDGFLARFQLRPDEIAVLKAPTLEPAFFPALDRVHTIQADCQLLIRTEHQEAGLQIVDMMAAHTDAAYERLYRWVQTECRTLDKDLTDIPPLLQQAVTALQRRSLLFTACLEEVSLARKSAVQRGFFDALTRGGPNGMPRPIELHAHDPIRYVGDMLAWLHQSVAWEHDLVCTLFGIPSSARGFSTETKSLDSAVSVQAIAEDVALQNRRDESRKVLDEIFKGVCRNFEVRFENTLLTQTAVVTAYRLASLFDFYNHTLRELMGHNACLIKTTSECQGKAMEKVFELLTSQADKITRSPPVPSLDLLPPPVAQDVLSKLGDVLATFNGGFTPESHRSEVCSPILRATIDPLLQMMNLSASTLRAADMAVYLINTLDAVRSKLSPYPFTKTYLEGVEAQIDAHMDTLMSEQTNTILNTCGVAEKIVIIQGHNKNGEVPLSTLPGMDAAAMTLCMRTFDQFLSATSVLEMPECDRIASLELRQEARSRVATQIANAYTTLYDAVTEKASGYKDVSGILLHKPSEVKTLLG